MKQYTSKIKSNTILHKLFTFYLLLLTSLGSLLDLFLYILIPLGFCFVAYLNFKTGTLENPFKVLSYSFLHGRLDLMVPAGTFRLDVVMVGDKTYWPFGPFPGIVLMPFIFLFGPGINLGYFHFFFNLLNFFLAIKIANRFLPKKTSLWLASAFIFASVYMGIVFESVSWYFSQTVAVSCLLLSINEFLGKKRPFLIGLFLSFAIATRMFIAVSALFFVFYFFLDKKNSIIGSVIKISFFSFPIIVTIVLLGFYNYYRFGSFTETGYNLHSIQPYSTALNRNRGLFRLENIPTNIYYYFFKGPDPILVKEKDAYLLRFPFIKANFWSLALIFTSPFFLLSIFRKPNSLQGMLSLSTFLLLFLMNICYFSPGFRQYGTRLLNDAFPFLYLFIIESRKKENLSQGSKILILFSMLLNFYLFYWGWKLEHVL